MSNKIEKMMGIVIDASKEVNIKTLCVDNLDFIQMRRMRDKTIDRDDVLIYSIKMDFFMYKGLYRFHTSENVCNRNKKTLQQSFKKHQNYSIRKKECEICIENTVEFIVCPTCSKRICYNCGQRVNECPFCKSAKKEILNEVDDDEDNPFIKLIIESMNYGHFIFRYYNKCNINSYDIIDKNLIECDCTARCGDKVAEMKNYLKG